MNGYLRGEDYPALVKVWDNEADAIYDRKCRDGDDSEVVLCQPASDTEVDRLQETHLERMDSVFRRLG